MADRPIERGLADRLVSAVAELGGGVPVDLDRVADALGVSAIVRAPMIEDGRTTWEEGRSRIELRDDRPAERAPFTLAHEIGHILIARDQTVARRTRDLHADDVETLCDWIAASILMPRRWAAGYAGRDQYNLSLLRLVVLPVMSESGTGLMSTPRRRRISARLSNVGWVNSTRLRLSLR